MTVESWLFVDGFTQPGGAWDPVVRAHGVPPALAASATLVGAPIAGTFVEASAALASAASRPDGDHRPEHGTHTAYAGYSQGGRLCLQLALDRPDVVHALVLVSASPGIESEAERAARRSADEDLARTIERDGVDAFLERWLAQPMFATLTPARAGLEERRQANTIEHLAYQLRVLGQGAQPSNWARLDELAMPVLVVVGALDAKYVAIGRRMAECIPEARLEVVPDAGHACHLERPEHVGHLLAEWSASL